MDNKKTADVTFADGRKIKIYVSSPTAKTVQKADIELKSGPSA